MRDHYGFTEAQILRLKTSGIGTGELFHAAREFRVWGTHEDTGPLSKVSLMCFIDRHGDFTEQKNTLHKIAMELFNKLDKQEQKEIIKYVEYVC